jgi:hypothetical protein
LSNGIEADDVIFSDGVEWLLFDLLPLFLLRLEGLSNSLLLLPLFFLLVLILLDCFLLLFLEDLHLQVVGYCVIECFFEKA